MSLSKEQFTSWVRSEIRQSIVDDVGSALPSFYKSGTGFFAVPRMLFPEIDGLGSYITGKKEATGENIVTYLKDVMSQIDGGYGKCAVFIAFIFRHGLLHQHEPKKFKYGKKLFGWQFSIDSGNIPEKVARKSHLVWERNILRINMNLFYKDVVDSIDVFISMIEDSKINFIGARSSFYSQIKPLLKKNIMKKGKNFVNNNDFQFLKSCQK